jgi:AraC-like DNA-binding protein
VTDAGLLALDWSIRGGTVALLLLTAGLLVRAHGRLLSARLGILFMIGSSAYTICSAAGLQGTPHPWAFPLLALSSGNNVVFWLLASALFDDGFRLRPWHAGLWLVMVALGLCECLLGGSRWLAMGLTISSLVFAGLALAPTFVSWKADLVEGRRRLRLFIVGAAALYIAITAVGQLAAGTRVAPVGMHLVGGIALLAIAGTVATTLLGISGRQALFVPLTVPVVPKAAAEPAAAPAPLAEAGDPADTVLLARLERLMTVDRAYRQDGLTIGALAQKLDLPEYRLRRLINQALGYRNFNAFLNGYRIGEAKAALADPAQAVVPVLTIAMDAGFSSLGPFNRAFKAETGLTPTDYRRQNAGIGRPIPDSAGPVSKPARGNLAAE